MLKAATPPCLAEQSIVFLAEPPQCHKAGLSLILPCELGSILVGLAEDSSLAYLTPRHAGGGGGRALQFEITRHGGPPRRLSIGRASAAFNGPLASTDVAAMDGRVEPGHDERGYFNMSERSMEATRCRYRAR